MKKNLGQTNQFKSTSNTYRNGESNLKSSFKHHNIQNNQNLNQGNKVHGPCNTEIIE